MSKYQGEQNLNGMKHAAKIERQKLDWFGGMYKYQTSSRLFFDDSFVEAGGLGVDGHYSGT